jgi:predicted membrane protein
MNQRRFLITLLLAAPIAEVAFAEGRLPATAEAAMSAFQSMVILFTAWVLAGGIVGALLAGFLGRKRKNLRQPLFSLSVFVGLCIAILHHLGKLPWA